MHMHVVYVLTLLVAYQVELVAGFSSGAPASTCSTLIPRHGNSTATGSAPYNLSLSAYTYKPGDTVQVTLSGLGGAQFKGFLIVAKLANGQSTDPFGNFTAAAGSLVVCPQSGNGITHSSNSVKTSVSFTWTAPSASVGDLVFHYTVVRGGAPNTNPLRTDYFQNLSSGTLKAADTISFTKNPECGKTRGCYSNCLNNDCSWELSWKNVGTKYEITIKAASVVDNTYVSLGFSNTSAMSPASVVTCVVYNGEVTVNASYNSGGSNRILGQPKDGISNETNSYSNGLLECSFSRDTTSNNPEVFNLTNPWYLITAKGPLTADGTLRYHGPLNRYKTDTQIDFSKAAIDYTFPVTTTTPPVPSAGSTGPTAPPPSANTFTKDPDCGKTKGCFSNCQNNICDLLLSWQDQGSNFKISLQSGFSQSGDHYIALGFSNSGGMNPASVLACAVFQSKVDVYASYNSDYSNSLLTNPKEGISNIAGSYNNGILSCTFLRETTSSNSQSFNLTDSSFIISARGGTGKDGALIKHGPSDSYATTTRINFSNATTDYNLPATATTPAPSTGSTTQPTPANTFTKDPDCGKTKGCFSNCQNNTCDLLMSWQDQGSTFKISLQSGFSQPGDHYIALGLSNSGGMGQASVLACAVFQSTVDVYASQNPSYSNSPLPNPKEGISNITGSYSNGILSCTFLRETKSSNSQIFNLTDPWYIISARGGTGKDGALIKHGPSDRFATTTRINFSNATTDYNLPATATTPAPSTGSTTQPAPASKFAKDPNCGKTKGCYGKCSDSMCDLLLSWQVEDDDKFKITITSGFSSAGNNYVAFGLGKDLNKMTPASVMACTVFQSVIQVYASTNPGYYNQLLINSTEGLSSNTGSYNNGVLSCTFLRDTNSSNPEIYNMNDSYYIISARGFTGQDGAIQPHGASQFFMTDTKVNFRDPTVDMTMGAQDFTLVKAHGCLMIITWMFAASLGLAMARFCKKLWPDSKICGVKIWFAVHRAVMVATFCIGIAAFVIIFVHVKAYSEIPGETFKKAHPILGIIVTSLLFINPFMSLLRCGPDHPNRPVFNWAHWLVGSSAHILGGITITFGLYLTSANLDSDKGLIIMIVYGSWQLVFFFIMSFLDYMSNAKPSKTISTNDQPLELTDVQPQRLGKSSYEMNDSGSHAGLASMNQTKYGLLTASNEPPFSGLKKLMMLAHVLMLTGLTISLMYLVINGSI